MWLSIYTSHIIIVDYFNVDRCSKDAGQNNFGNTLLQLCCNLNIHVLNGRCDGDVDGEFTFMSHIGKSVIDYFIVSSELFHSFSEFRVLDCDISDHFPIMACFNSDSVHNYESIRTARVKYRWNENHKEEFINRQNDEITANLIENFYDVLQYSLDDAVSALCDLLYYAGGKMLCKPRTNKLTQPRWWNLECETAKREKYCLLNEYRCTGFERDLDRYKTSKNHFKHVCDRAQKQSRKQIVDNTCHVFTTPNKLWNKLKLFTHNKISEESISAESWLEYFQSLLDEARNPLQIDFEEGVDEFISFTESIDFIEELDEEITYEEIINVIHKMKNNKASGPDGIVIEMYKYSEIIVPCLHLLYNQILQSGTFPKAWCEAIICPIHKKGDKSDPNNYRGISLLNVMGKIFTKILNDRLVTWAEHSEKLYEEQSGYRRRYNTIDNCFTLQALIQKYISRPKGRLYCIFIDFSKAFDCVNHKLLHYVLLKNGVSGKIVTVIKSLYSNLKSCVQINGGLSEYFACNVGTRQGCMLSPFLFVLFLNDLIEMFKLDDSCKGIFVNENVPNISQLLFADDIADTADTIIGLQRHINKISEFCEKYGMRINLEKTKIIVFRRGGYLKKKERWFYQGTQIETVAFYKYLGMIFSAFLSWSKAKNTVAQQAEKAMNILLSFIRRYQVNMSQSFYLFDHAVLPILCYGAEIWGYEKCEQVERVHYKFCKKLLRINSTTANMAVLGETGRRPLYTIYFLRCIKYWTKLLRMDLHRFPRACYDMMLALDNGGRKTWVTYVKNLVFSHGFGYVWLAQDIGDIRLFLYQFSQRLNDCSYQFWKEGVDSSPKLRTYSLFKSQLEPELYLSDIHIAKYRTALCKFRTSAHKLQIEIGRHDGTSLDSRLCKYCLTIGCHKIEDERHFLLECPLYKDLRIKHSLIFCDSSMNTFIIAMSSKNRKQIFNISAYIHHSFLLRRNTLELL